MLRLGAFVIDFIFIFFVAYAFELLVKHLADLPELVLRDPDLAIWIVFPVVIVKFVTPWLYFAIMHSSGGQSTFGKRVFGIKVMTLDGKQLSFSQASRRFVARILSTLVFLLGYIWAAFDEESRAWHDILAGTLVVIK